MEFDDVLWAIVITGLPTGTVVVFSLLVERNNCMAISRRGRRNREKTIKVKLDKRACYCLMKFSTVKFSVFLISFLRLRSNELPLNGIFTQKISVSQSSRNFLKKSFSRFAAVFARFELSDFLPQKTV